MQFVLASPLDVIVGYIYTFIMVLITIILLRLAKQAVAEEGPFRVDE